MTDNFTHDVSNNEPNHQPSATNEALAELRSLLLGIEQSELEKLQQRLDNPNINSEDISRLLPEAVMLRSLRDKQLSEAIVPTVEEAIDASVKKDLNILADSIFPVIGPASRKAIATALEAALQSLNQVVDHSVSPQSFKWRLEALQTGKSFAEVVLLRTLLYRVEQVFLIHKKTGLLLQHVLADGVAAMDADLVSAMLTAIQDFVRDSFSVPTDDTLETLQYGDLTIWIEQGPQAILAGAIRGNAPIELRFVFQDALEKIHRHRSSELKSFQGDTAPFEASKPYLEACLQAQYQPKKTKVSPVLWVLLGAVLFGLGTWGFFEFQANRRWSAYLEKLQAEPGIVVTEAKKRYGKYYISGLRDPLTADPIKIMQETKVNPAAVISRWEPYLSLESELLAARAKQLLQPPKTVSLRVDKNNILYATGSASRRWILETRRLVRTIPGVTKFQEENLIETDFKQLESLKTRIEKQVIRFVRGTKQLTPGQNKTLQTLVRDIQKITALAPVLGKNVRMEIIGHTDTGGVERTNIILSQARADTIRSTLVSQGITTHLSTVALGSKKPLSKGLSEQNKAINRSVSFKVILTNASD
jgi:outer membrane protein OmpA-like peptidoglycan-associated protein